MLTSQLKHDSHKLISAVLYAAVLVPVIICGSAANGKDISIRIDEANIIRLDRPGTEIIVGNPAIADVTVQNAKLLVITGKSYGMTNLIVLDQNGSEILNAKLLVSMDSRQFVTLRKGASRESYHCAPICQPPLVIGDEAGHYANVNKAITTKIKTSSSAAEGGDGAE